MRTPTLPELRRFLGRALLAAPLALAGCQHAEAPRPPPPVPADAHVVRAAPIDGGAIAVIAPDAHAAPDALAPPPPPPDAGPIRTGKCLHDAPDITGCGGAEVHLHSSLADCNLPADGEVPKAQCDVLCKGFDTRSCRVYSGHGAPEVFCDAAHPCMGRLASDGAVDGARHDDAALDHLALARRMEAQSVAAFRELGADLARWGAPAHLLQRTKKAARDEARHAAAMTRLLRARGVAPEPLARTRAPGFASLFALALHNEREGTVGETWGALVAMHQAAHAQDLDVRTALAAIADEETAHAALSFEIAAWARTQLDAREVTALDHARAHAFAELRASYAPADDAAVALGWPDAHAHAALLDQLAPLFASA